MGHVAYSSKKRLFEPVSGRFTPIRLTNPCRERHGLPTLAAVLPPATDSRVPPSTPLPAAEAEERWFGARADGVVEFPLPRFVIGNSPRRRCLQGAAHLGIGPPGFLL